MPELSPEETTKLLTVALRSVRALNKIAITLVNAVKYAQSAANFPPRQIADDERIALEQINATLAPLAQMSDVANATETASINEESRAEINSTPVGTTIASVATSLQDAIDAAKSVDSEIHEATANY